MRLGISLDGSYPEIHDTFRGLPGAWARTIQAIEWADEAGLPIQVHTTISRHNAHDLDNLCKLFEKLAIVMWNVFFLVPVGRGQLADLLSGEEFEQVFGKIYELSPPRQLPDQDHRGHALSPLPPAAQPRRAQMGHGSGHPHAGASGSTNPARPTGRRPDPHRKLGDAARQRRQRLYVHLPRRQRLSQRLPAHPRRQRARERPWPRSTAKRPSSSRCATPASWKANAAPASTRRSAAVPGRAPYALTGDPLAQEPCCIYQPKNWDPESSRRRSPSVTSRHMRSWPHSKI